MRLFTRGHFRSGDKDGGHTNRSATVENPMLHANLVALNLLYNRSYGRWNFTRGNKNFRPFSSCDLDLDTMTFIYDLDPYCGVINGVCKYDLPTLMLNIRKL